MIAPEQAPVPDTSEPFETPSPAERVVPLQSVTGSAPTWTISAATMPPRYRRIVLGSALLMLSVATSPPLGPLASTAIREMVTCVSGALGIALLVHASLSVRLPQDTANRHVSCVRSRGALVLAALLVVGALTTFTGATTLFLSGTPAQSYMTDVLSLAHENASLALSGQNPYTTSTAFRDTLRRFPAAYTTPLRGPVFGAQYALPSVDHMTAVQRQYAQSPATVPGAFDPATSHSYPALSFLLYVPLLWAGIPNILYLHILVYWCLFAWLVWLTPIGWRHWGALVALAAMPTIAASLIVTNEVISIALVLTAWHLRHRLWACSILLGLACAYKQYAWFFVPFFALDLLHQCGWREMLRRGVLTLAVFLVPNMPYLLASPGAWFQSLWLPMTEPLFASGIGIIALPLGNVLPFAPPAVYALVEALALLAMLAAYARWRPQIGDAALLLALVPLFFAFRSLPNYFAFLPWLALYAANRQYSRVVPPTTSLLVTAVLAGLASLRNSLLTP